MTKPALNVQNFPNDLHTRFKALAALHHLSVREATIQAVSMWVEAHMDSGIATLPGRSRVRHDGHTVTPPNKVRRRTKP